MAQCPRAQAPAGERTGWRCTPRGGVGAGEAGTAQTGGCRSWSFGRRGRRRGMVKKGVRGGGGGKWRIWGVPGLWRSRGRLSRAGPGFGGGRGMGFRAAHVCGVAKGRLFWHPTFAGVAKKCFLGGAGFAGVAKGRFFAHPAFPGVAKKRFSSRPGFLGWLPKGFPRRFRKLVKMG